MTLRRESVTPELLELLRGLMEERGLEPFSLGGGTSLALRRGHRASVDIDLFSPDPFDADELGETLSAGRSLSRIAVSRSSLSFECCGIKVDLIAHRYPAIAPAQTIEGVRMLSEPDVAAMKLNAIRNRGAKKDYWDLAELLPDYGIDELVRYYALKYSQENLWSLTRSILYFDDAEEEPDPRDLKGRTWDEVKALIRSRVRL